MFSELTRERWRRFRKIRRAYWALWILGLAFGIALLSECVANDKPLYLRYEGRSYFPFAVFYPETTFGGPYRTEADYPALGQDPAFRQKGFMIFPPIRSGPARTHLEEPGPPPHPPSLRHWLGTDASARDVLARLIYGFRSCMVFALLLTLAGALVGIVIGGLQGYIGGATDLVTQRLIEIWSSLPFLYVVILVGATYGRSFWLLLAVMALFQWIGLSYYMRGEFLKLRNMTYVKVAQALGLSPLRIFFQEILPNALTPVVTLLPFSLVGGITALTALDFLGFGLPPPAPSWGELLSQGLDHLYAPWIAVSTVTALFTTLLLATFIGEGVREALDPRAEYRIE